LFVFQVKDLTSLAKSIDKIYWEPSLCLGLLVHQILTQSLSKLNCLVRNCLLWGHQVTTFTCFSFGRALHVITSLRFKLQGVYSDTELLGSLKVCLDESSRASSFEHLEEIIFESLYGFDNLCRFFSPATCIVKARLLFSVWELFGRIVFQCTLVYL